MVQQHTPCDRRKPSGKKKQNSRRRRVLVVEGKKTQPKKTPLSNRLIYRTIRTALAQGNGA
jgi:hypothetical protein